MKTTNQPQLKTIDEIYAQSYMSAWHDGADDSMDNMAEWTTAAKQAIRESIDRVRQGNILSVGNKAAAHIHNEAVHRFYLDLLKELGV